MSSVILNEMSLWQLKTNDPEERFITSGVSWDAYESLLQSLENRSFCRLAYLLGTLEIMSPSRNHELDKKAISRLLEIYLEENQIPFWGLGSTTFRDREKKVGKEPDECYCINSNKDIPDLAIEVVYTSGGLDILKIYQLLGIKEVWLWQNNQFQVYCLQNEELKKKAQSKLFPDLDLDLLGQLVTINDPLQSIIEWRKQVRKN